MLCRRTRARLGVGTSFKKGRLSRKPLPSCQTSHTNRASMTNPIEKASQPATAELSRLGIEGKSKLSCQIRTTENGALEHPLPVADLPRQRWYQWFSPSDTPEERRLIMKLDGLIMVFVFLAYWAKVLDSSATSAAYVSGMKEDLKLFGNELNYLNTTYM